MQRQAKQTALITGASSGAGVEFARELARRDFDLILTARRVDRLEAMKVDLTDQHDVDVEVVPSDLGRQDGASQLHHQVGELGRDVSMLINNAGHGRYGPLLEQSVAEMEAMIQLNATSLSILTRLFAEDFKQRGGGYILNHASFSAIQPPSQYAVYAGTKSFVLAFSLALREDLQKHGVKVSALCPGFFESEFLDKAEQELSWLVRRLMLKSSEVAQAGVRGVLRGTPVIIPGIPWKLLNLWMKVAPRSFATGLADFAVMK